MILDPVRGLLCDACADEIATAMTDIQALAFIAATHRVPVHQFHGKKAPCCGALILVNTTCCDRAHAEPVAPLLIDITVTRIPRYEWN